MLLTHEVIETKIDNMTLTIQDIEDNPSVIHSFLMNIEGNKIIVRSEDADNGIVLFFSKKNKENINRNSLEFEEMASELEEAIVRSNPVRFMQKLADIGLGVEYISMFYKCAMDSFELHKLNNIGPKLIEILKNIPGKDKPTEH